MPPPVCHPSVLAAFGRCAPPTSPKAVLARALVALR
jgi:hypothetical protein